MSRLLVTHFKAERCCCFIRFLGDPDGGSPSVVSLWVCLSALTGEWRCSGEGKSESCFLTHRQMSWVVSVFAKVLFSSLSALYASVVWESHLLLPARLSF